MWLMQHSEAGHHRANHPACSSDRAQTWCSGEGRGGSFIATIRTIMEVLAVTIVVHHDVANLAAEVCLRESARIRELDAAGLRPSAAHAAAEFLVVRHFHHHNHARAAARA